MINILEIFDFRFFTNHLPPRPDHSNSNILIVFESSQKYLHLDVHLRSVIDPPALLRMLTLAATLPLTLLPPAIIYSITVFTLMAVTKAENLPLISRKCSKFAAGICNASQ
jgi:hypothetical protein